MLFQIKQDMDRPKNLNNPTTSYRKLINDLSK